MSTERKLLFWHTRIIVVILAGLIFSQTLDSQGWRYRIPVTVSNPGITNLIDFQININLNSTNFDFSKTLSDGSDIRFATSDGTSLIPFWLETWDQANDTASIWVKVPDIPIGGTIVYLYYGNSDPIIHQQTIVETPPSGPYTKVGRITPIDDPGAGASLLAENLVYDEVTGHYWMVFASYRADLNRGVGLVWSDDPADPTQWHWQTGNPVIPGGNAPHIINHNGTWYIFYAYNSRVAVATSSSVSGPYTFLQYVLLPGAAGTWEDARVDEPYVFQRSDGKWILMYMGDAGGAVEQVSYATADGILGPYTKFGSDPFIPFGLAGSFDAGTVADPWVYEYDGVYYIGYTVSPTTSSPWQTALATTTDFQTYTKHGIILPLGTESNSFRGAVTRIGDEYVFPYTSDSYDMRIAIQPVYRIYANPVDNVDAVFDFFDDFDGDSLDTDKWVYREANDTAQASISSGFLTLTSALTSNYVRIDGTSAFGYNYIGETRARHPNTPATSMIAEYGFAQGVTNFDIRITDNFTAIGRWQRYVATDSASFGPPTDTDWHIYKIFRESPGMAGFMIDNASATVTSGVSTLNLHPFLMSYGTNNQFMVDWTRVRKWAGSDPVTSFAAEESLNTRWTGSLSNDWGTPGNWTAGVPAEWSLIDIQSATNSPLFSGSLEIGPTASMMVEPGGALTISGDLANAGLVTVSSTMALSGSLIISGNSTGSITYNRQLKAGSDEGSDWHLAAPPVAINAYANAGKISTVYQWSEPAGAWTNTNITSALSGHGYNIRQEATSDGRITFTGPLVNNDVTVAASSPYSDAIGPGESYFNRTFVAGRSLTNMGGSGWNLLGNPYPSAISASAFIDANYSATPSMSQFDPNYVALYLFDGTARRYYYLANSTGWPSGVELSGTHVQAGQGFFVLAMNDNSEFTFTRAMREHRTSTPMLKSGDTDDRWPGLQLKAKHSSGEVITTIVYDGSMTPGVDPGYDIGLFKSGQDIEIYTTLMPHDNGVNYTRQALPSGGADTLRIPVGIDYKAGGEVTFSAITVPLGGRRFWLEDRTAGLFTDLSLKSYTVTLPANSYGTGRFYLLASANTPTGMEQLPDELDDLRIWVSNGRLIIKGAASKGSLCEIYDMNGRMLLKSILTDGELNIVDLPASTRGVVLVKVTDGIKVTTRKIAVI